MIFFLHFFLLYRPLRHSELWVLCQIPVLGKCIPYHPHLREVNKALLCKVGCPLLNAGQVGEVHAQVRDTWRITAVQTKQKYTVFMNWFETCTLFSSARWLYLLFQCLSEVLEPSLWWHNLLKSVPQSLCLKIMKKRVFFFSTQMWYYFQQLSERRRINLFADFCPGLFKPVDGTAFECSIDLQYSVVVIEAATDVSHCQPLLNGAGSGGHISMGHYLRCYQVTHLWNKV